MHICVIFFNLGGYHLARLEAARQCCDARGWQFSAVQVAGTTREHPWGAFDIPKYVHTLSSHIASQRREVGFGNAMSSVLHELSPDVVAIPGWGFEFSRAALKWCRKHQRIPVLMCESKYDDAPRLWFKELAKRYLSVSRYPVALVGGQKHAAYLQRLGMPKNRIFFGYDVVDNEYFAARTAQLRDRGDAASPDCVRGRKYFLAANRFIERKNLARLIKAFHLVLQRDPQYAADWDLVLLGGGKQDADLRRLASKLGLSSRVHFPGFVGYQAIPTWYAFAQCFIHPALSEQWGLVVNEALAAGLPIILSNTCGCHPELLREGKNGFSIDPYSEASIAQAMTKILAGLPGAADTSRQIIEDFSPTSFGRGLLAAIDACDQ